MDFLVGFVVVVLLVTLVGHGLWRLFAIILRAMFGSPKSKLVLPPPLPVARPVDELGITLSKLAQLRSAGLIDPAVHAQVFDALQRVQTATAPVPHISIPTVANPVVLTAAEVPAIPPPLPLPAVHPTEPLAAMKGVAQPPAANPARLARIPSRSMSEVFASFMQQSNIRWGELIGGLLIIGCSAALVVSFWAEISQRPIFKFSLFTAVTAALFGMGLYSEHRWKLPTTSRGVLLIATLLVPLNCLALAAFSPRGAPAVFALGAQAVALLLFTWLLWLSAKVISPQWPGLLTVGTVLLSAFMLVLRIVMPTDPTPRQTFMFAAAPVAIYVLLSATMLRTARRWRTLRAPASEGIFLLLGTFTFATVLGVLLLISQASQQESRLALAGIAQTLRNICAVISTAGLPSLTSGLLVWQRAKGVRSNAIRITGGAIAIIGAGILLLGLALAWPQPSAILPVAAFDFLTLLVIAVLYELPAALLLAIPCLGVAWLVGFHVLAGHLAWHDPTGAAATILLEPSGGTALAPFALGLAGGALLLRRKRTYGRIIAGMAAASAVLSVVLLNAHGFALHGDPNAATWVYLCFALALFIAARLIPLDWLVFPGWTLAFATFAQFFVAHDVSSNPWATSLLAWSTVAALAFAVVRVTRSGTQSSYETPAYWIALIASLIGGAVLCTTRQGTMSAAVPYALFWLAGIWILTGASARQLLIAAAAICFAITAAYVPTIRPAPTELSLRQVVRLLELNSTALSLIALVASRFRKGFLAGESPAEPSAIRIQLSVASVLLALVVLPATATIALAPGFASHGFVGDFWTWLAVGALAGALFGRQKVELYDVSINTFAITLLALAALIACTINRFTAPSWHAYHALLAANAAVGWFFVGYGVWVGSRLLGFTDAASESVPSSDSLTLSYHQPAQSSADLVQTRASLMFGGSRVQPTVIFWAIGIIVGVVLLSARGALDDPAAPWWAVGAIVAVASLLPMLASWAYRPSLLYPASVLFNLAAVVWFGHTGHQLFVGNTFQNFVFVNVIVLALSGLAWLVIDVNIFHAAKLPRTPGTHRAAAVISVLAMAVLTAYCLSTKLLAVAITPGDVRLIAGALAAVTAIVTACLWDRGASQPLATLYSVELLVIASAFAFSAADAKSSVWGISIVLAGYSLLIATLWSVRAHVIAMARVLAIPTDGRTWQIAWLIPVKTFVVMITVLIAYWADFAFLDRLHRVAPPLAASAGGVALVLLAWGNLKVGVRQSALAVFALSAVAVAWAIMQPGHATILDRSVAVFVVLIAVAAIYLLMVPRVVPPGSAWISVAIGEGLHLGIIAGVAVLFALGVEVSAYISHNTAPISRVDIAVMLVALLATCALLVVVAIRKKDLSSWIRSACIYGAEATLALTFVHLRVTMPQLFGGMFAAYWPLVLMAIAFAGVGTAEVLRRKYDAVLVRPIEQSGIFLPLLPVLAFWLAPPRAVNFGELLLTVSFFYGLVSALRRSFLFAIVGVLAANGALWYLLKQTPGWAFNEHPQVWLIPGALAVLIAAQFNRKRMTAEQLRTLRYACLLVIYASSTADVFLNGVAKQPWLPLVLAALSVVGVLLGIVLRIRPFLYLGTSFLAVSILTMIYYAFSELHWTWIWYVAGIGLGGGIILLFALFEKQREKLVGIVEGLQQWQ